MYTAQSKKISIIAILEILNKYSDKDHRLSASEEAAKAFEDEINK